MSRFQIEDIVEQDKHEVVYKAIDVETGRTVALRRFLPFGQDGGGLQKDESLAFESAAQRLAAVSHVALRSVIMGSTDPIDGIPYLATEWVEGMSLGEVLDGENLDPAIVIDVLRIALEVSIIISHVLGEEAVWVETEVDSIIIGEEGSGRGFTFWISPFKWLGAQFESRKLSSIVDLGEELAGWKRKMVSDQAGHGLGGWLKWLKKNPDVRLAEALEMLAVSTGKEASPTEADLIESATKPQNFQLKQPPAWRPLLFAGIAALLVIPAALFFLYKPAKPPQIAAAQSEKEISPAIKNPEPARTSAAVVTPPKEPAAVVPPSKEPAAVESPKEPADAQDPAARANALAKKLSEAATANDRALGQPTGLPTKPAATPAPPMDPGRIFKPKDKHHWAEIKGGSAVKLGGVLQGVRVSSTGKSIYLDFDNPPTMDKLAGVIHQRDFKGDFLPKTFEPMIGKKLVLTGTCFKEPGGKFLVKIQAEGQIEVVR